MAEPDDIVLELLRAIRADMTEVKGQVGELRDRMEGVETRLDGLTHVTMAGCGSVVHRLDAIEMRVSRLERERA